MIGVNDPALHRGCDAGTVAAVADWGGEMAVRRVRPSLADSSERLCQQTGQPRCLLVHAAEEELDAERAEERLDRFIGVIDRPRAERYSELRRSVIGAATAGSGSTRHRP
ncbi:erythromycin esterase family protein [uncultured Jannaschia sp.]|uniref:erythromycin esterase family protein n=1 Tax=uncultured Jannaschia sp. TaxID=293347 RepID=UPI00262CD25C|nr:erythromycin esterase family protein [uncultured Jannaschia sp.]